MRWLTSKIYRRARELKKQVRKHVAAQSDVLGDEELQNISTAQNELVNAMASGASDEELTKCCDQLEHVANKNLRPYPHSAIRENIEVLLVAVAVAMGVRTFFLQPFKIPTGSMQPSLYGITTDNLNQTDEEIPGLFGRIYDRLILGTSYYHLTAKTDGRVSVNEPKTIIPFLLRKQTIMVGNERQTIWNPPKNLSPKYPRPMSGEPFLNNAGVSEGQVYQKGDKIINLKVVRGDYLFVDRLTYNFRRPNRGDIIVFKTEGIEPLERDGQGDLFYIKRLVGMPDEEIRIGDDRHLVVDGVRLDDNTPRFERVYGFDPNEPPAPSEFSGHVNGEIAQQYGMPRSAVKQFPDSSTVFQIRPDHYLAMGDNTMSSKDGRDWGDLPRENVMGKYAFVFWPFTDRSFGRVR